MNSGLLASTSSKRHHSSAYAIGSWARWDGPRACRGNDFSRGRSWRSLSEPGKQAVTWKYIDDLTSGDKRCVVLYDTETLDRTPWPQR